MLYKFEKKRVSWPINWKVIGEQVKTNKTKIMVILFNDKNQTVVYLNENNKKKLNTQYNQKNNKKSIKNTQIYNVLKI